MRKANAHLTDEEFALYTDAIILSSVNRLPNEILCHVMECTYCKKELMELQNLIEEQESHTHPETHPFFGRTIV
jgi:hypothetical protein